MSAEVYKAMIKVMSSVGYVQKQRVKGLNYTYAGERALIEALRPAMVDAGLFIFPLEVVNHRQDDYTTKSGAIMQRDSVVVKYRIAHTSGEHIDIETVGLGADTGDKSSNKAMTGALKYALRQAFLIETGDDPDKDASVAATNRKPVRQAAPNGDTSAMVKRLHILGKQLYGDEWDAKKEELVQSYTKDANRKSSRDLNADQLAQLINGLQKRLPAQPALVEAPEAAVYN